MQQVVRVGVYSSSANAQHVSLAHCCAQCSKQGLLAGCDSGHENMLVLDGNFFQVFMPPMTAAVEQAILAALAWPGGYPQLSMTDHDFDSCRCPLSCILMAAGISSAADTSSSIIGLA